MMVKLIFALSPSLHFKTGESFEKKYTEKRKIKFYENFITFPWLSCRVYVFKSVYSVVSLIALLNYKNL